MAGRTSYKGDSCSISGIIPVSDTVHIGTKVELGICGVDANWAKNSPPYILIFAAILSLIEHVKTLNGRYLLKESFFKQFY